MDEYIQEGIMKTNCLKDTINNMSLSECTIALKHLAECTRNIDGTPSVLVMNHTSDDLFIHVFADAFGIAGVFDE